MSAGGESRKVPWGVCCCLALAREASVFCAGDRSCLWELLMGQETSLLPFPFFSPSVFSGGWEQLGRGGGLGPFPVFFASG